MTIEKQIFLYENKKQNRERNATRKEIPIAK